MAEGRGRGRGLRPDAREMVTIQQEEEDLLIPSGSDQTQHFHRQKQQPEESNLISKTWVESKSLDFSWWLSVMGLFVYAVCGDGPLSWTGFSVQAFLGLSDFFKHSPASGVLLFYVLGLFNLP